MVAALFVRKDIHLACGVSTLGELCLGSQCQRKLGKIHDPPIPMQSHVACGHSERASARASQPQAYPLWLQCNDTDSVE